MAPATGMADTMPLTLLVGIAGAGKTTPLRRLLSQREADAIAVVAVQPNPPMRWNAAWPTTWEDGGRTVCQLAKLANKPMQDPATRAWNLFRGLYYKAGNVPWRLPRDPAQFDTSYVGISFYRDLSGQRLLTSTAQMFDEPGQGLNPTRGSGQDQQAKSSALPFQDRCI